MKPSFLERYGFHIAVALISLFAWRLISTDLHLSPELQLLFPLHWLTYTPLSNVTATLTASFSSTPWWMWVEIGATVFGWMVVYYTLRGIFYKVLSMEGPSMWVAFFIFILIAFVFFAVIVAPAFDQIAVWWKAWPTKAPALP